ncbi:MAG TPA: flagellar hook capping FlgD N-terminal domain-containing protein, partial [Gryllotalpicola sp.]
MTAVDPVSAASAPTSIYSPPSTDTSTSQVMDSSMFLQLLVTQLQNQDPTSPMDTNQMISQTTQLATMEKLTDMATTSQDGFALQMRSAAAEMIGRVVEYADADGKVQTGTAGSVAYDGV